MTRLEIEQRFIEMIEDDIAALEKSLKMAELGATHGDSKQEGKYDTRAIESSYLAGAQKHRHEQLKTKLSSLKLEFSSFQPSQVVAVCCCVELAHGSDKKIFLISKALGGYTFMSKNIKVSLVSMDSPLVKDLLEQGVGDEVEISGLDWEIVNIF